MKAQTNRQYFPPISGRTMGEFSLKFAETSENRFRTFSIPSIHRIFKIRSRKEKRWKEYREIYPLTNLGERFILKRPIILTIDHKPSEVIVSSNFPHLFAYADSRDEAIKSYKSLLRDYLKHLKTTTRTLAPNLREELDFLQKNIQDRAH